MARDSIKIEPIQPGPNQSGVDFGAVVHGIDLETMTDKEFEQLEKAVYTYQVVVVRGQQHITPAAQFRLTQRFEPGLDTYTYGHGLQHRAKESVISRDISPFPDVPQVQLLGHGTVRHYHNIDERQLVHPDHRVFHHTPLSPEDIASGKTRFYRWHMDAALYKLEPTKVTSLFCVKNPASREQVIQYDDGSGHTLPVQLGTTAFISGQKAFELLPREKKLFASRTKVKYAPHPYVWMSKAKARSTGLGMVSEGKELDYKDLPPIDEQDIKIYPMLWKNPVTNKIHLQVHPSAVEDLIVDGEPIGDLEKVRDILNDMLRPAINPENVYAHDWKEGDMALFHNRGVLHSVVGCMQDTDQRIFHQCVLASASPPLAATEEDLAPYLVET